LGFYIWMNAWKSCSHKTSHFLSGSHRVLIKPLPCISRLCTTSSWSSLMLRSLDREDPISFMRDVSS
jgi:hypothetical protein